MELKKLELHGFKTFAGKTQFQFTSGITAVVGPNGSGKSNLADAVRWILGEQRSTVLRARKSEDMIFSGTERRARMGMAQGFLTIDNSEGLLPIDFSEVVVGRRAYRSGESEYLINGSKVRLRDVQELLAHAGIGTSTYTVIGQGLVDAALALRAEERRQLFEDAAGLGAYQGKRDEALRRLGQTEEHLTRVRDILAEIEPRMNRLKRQAERAEEYIELTTALNDLLRQLYGYRYGQAAQALADARGTLAGDRNELQAASMAVAGVEKQLDTLRQRQAQLREQLEGGRRERGRLRAEAERLRRERAVAVEREKGFARQQEALQQERETLQAEASELESRLAQLESEGEALQTTRREAQTALADARRELSEAESIRDGIRRRLDEARRALGRLSARQGELTQRRSALGDRQKELAREQATHDRALAEMDQRLERHEADLTILEEEHDTLQQQRSALTGERAALSTERQAEVGAQRVAQDALHAIQRRLADLTARRDVLARLRREGAGYQPGVRTLLAERKRFGQSLLGPVADLLRVPQELSTAISAALGERLQAVAVRDDGEAIRLWLNSGELGRVTQLPLSMLRGPENARVPTGDGVLGRGADLVQADDPALLEHLLGDWLVLDDWGAGDQLGATGREWNLVTLDGQVRAREGSITTGRINGQSSTLLAQSREWAELPARVAEVEREQSAAQQVLYDAAERLDEIERRLQKLEREILESERQLQKSQGALDRERRETDKLEQEKRWRQGLVSKIHDELSALEGRAATFGAELAQLQEERAGTEQRIVQLEQELEAAHPGTLREAVERARTRVAVSEEQLAGWQRSRDSAREALARLVQRQATKAEQAKALDVEAAGLTARTAALEEEASTAESELETSLQQSRPLEQEMGRNEERLAELEEQHLGLRKRRHLREEQAHTAHLALQAAEERLAHLREQIEADLGMVEVDDSAEDMAHQSLLPIEELVTSLPKVISLPDGLENDVRRLRRRIGYLGAINPDAPAEYAELRERFTFLSEQSEDLSRASQDLRKIVAELDQIMRERFVTTFRAIDQAFQGYFHELFNGGQARLELTEPDNPTSTGVDIVARPPGKRSQSISLLSGGERALTAAALIFAILKVSPAPFCVLDEVDAMLDEANVGRFRDTLSELAAQTQFIVVTHNRGTIEAASAIYGISQSDPGISEVISLQLDEAIRAAKH